MKEVPSCDKRDHYQRSLANQPNHAKFKEAQDEESFCGPLCLQEIAQLEGRYYTAAQLTRITRTDENGTSHEQLFSGAREIGLAAAQVQGMGIEMLGDMLPWYHVIVNWMSGPNDVEDGHYSILRSVDEGMVFLSDHTLPIDQFDKHWYDIEDNRVDRWALVIKRTT